jgi:hypothetical protein
MVGEEVKEEMVADLFVMAEEEVLFGWGAREEFLSYLYRQEEVGGFRES